MVDANNLSKYGESLLVIVYVLIRQLKGSQPELISEFVNSLTVTRTKKYFVVGCYALFMRHGQHRRQRPSKELPIGSVLVEVQPTTIPLAFATLDGILSI